MRIAVNTRLLIKGKLEGIGRFTMETLKRITRDHPEHQFIFIFDRPYSREFIFSDNILPVVAGPPARHPFLFYVWFEWQIPRLLKKYKADLFLSPDGYLSLNTKIPQLPVIHDLSFVHRPKDLTPLMSRHYNYFFPRFAQKAKRIATVSNYSKNDIARTFNIDKRKIDVVYSANVKNLKPLDLAAQEKVRETHTSGNPYILFVGALHPRKNITGLLKAFDLFKTSADSNMKLLIVGGKMHKTGEIFIILEKLSFKEDVIFAGRVSDEELHKIYGAAFALAFVPFFEGFGVPVIEAMSAGTPVICSSTPSLPEVGGDAVLYVNPDNIEQIADALLKLNDNPELRAKLIEKGFEQKSRFSWDETARLLWQSVEKII
ncbi:MAG: glycosyltransferase family 1 protein [Mariniphaga sp.]|jgi:glycosyltransferase involved in cell wall biosynthesis|nr:glycosyltransferase family 1 protein [Mariniphaga sp.]